MQKGDSLYLVIKSVFQNGGWKNIGHWFEILSFIS